MQQLIEWMFEVRCNARIFLVFQTSQIGLSSTPTTSNLKNVFDSFSEWSWKRIEFAMMNWNFHHHHQSIFGVIIIVISHRVQAFHSFTTHKLANVNGFDVASCSPHTPHIHKMTFTLILSAQNAAMLCCWGWGCCCGSPNKVCICYELSGHKTQGSDVVHLQQSQQFWWIKSTEITTEAMRLFAWEQKLMKFDNYEKREQTKKAFVKPLEPVFLCFYVSQVSVMMKVEIKQKLDSGGCIFELFSWVERQILGRKCENGTFHGSKLFDSL